MKLDNPKGSYAHLTFGVLKSTKWRNRLSKFVVYHWINGHLSQKSLKLHHLGFKFWSKTFTHRFITHNNYDFVKISKLIKVTPKGIFSHISIWGLAQKRLISIEWITYGSMKVTLISYLITLRTSFTLLHTKNLVTSFLQYDFIVEVLHGTEIIE